MRVLVVAGSDSGGGAGLQADIKTITMLGAFAATAVTALTAQNTLGVSAVLPVPADFVRKQMRAVLDDIGADVVKTGMLFDAEIVGAVADELNATNPRPRLVLDPVMVAKGGASLLSREAESRLLDRLLPLCDLVTPNAPEAEVLTGRRVANQADMIAAGRDLLLRGAGAALIKGGHLAGDEVLDVLVTTEGERLFRAPRIHTRSTHGTGCTLASAIAASLALGRSLPGSVEAARAYVRGALTHAPGLGAGHGPLGHGWLLRAETLEVLTNPATRD